MTGGFGQAIGQVDGADIQTFTATDAGNRPIDIRVIKTQSNGTKTLLRWTQREYDLIHLFLRIKFR
jgi:hypothetical protein